jgi:hypothetical protein
VVAAFGTDTPSSSNQTITQVTAPTSPSKLLVEHAWDAMKWNENLQPQDLAAARKIFRDHMLAEEYLIFGDNGIEQEARSYWLQEELARVQSQSFFGSFPPPLA